MSIALGVGLGCGGKITRGLGACCCLILPPPVPIPIPPRKRRHARSAERSRFYCPPKPCPPVVEPCPPVVEPCPEPLPECPPVEPPCPTIEPPYIPVVEPKVPSLPVEPKVPSLPVEPKVPSLPVEPPSAPVEVPSPLVEPVPVDIPVLAKQDGEMTFFNDPIDGKSIMLLTLAEAIFITGVFAYVGRERSVKAGETIGYVRKTEGTKKTAQREPEKIFDNPEGSGEVVLYKLNRVSPNRRVDPIRVSPNRRIDKPIPSIKVSPPRPPKAIEAEADSSVSPNKPNKRVELPDTSTRRFNIDSDVYVVRWIKGHAYLHKRIYLGSQGSGKPLYRDDYKGRIDDDVAAGDLGALASYVLDNKLDK